jgi:hypothetical protein
VGGLVSAYSELCESGKLGPDGVVALYRAVAAVARFDRYPPPEGHDRWDAAAVRDVATGFLAGPRSTERLVQLAVAATDDESFGRLIEAAVRNYFRSEARRTAGGKLYRRLRSLLEGADGIVEVREGVFALEGQLEPATRGFIDALIAVAWAVDIEGIPGQLDADGNLRISRRALDRLCRAVLAEAGGPLDLDQLLYVIGSRLGLREPPLVVDVDSLSGSGDAPRPDDEAVDNLSAEEIFAALSDRERITLVVLEESVREAASFVGVGKSSMAETMGRLRNKLDELLPHDEHRGPVLAKLVELAVLWTQGPGK